jgi:uncharacterized protein with HEPN domain
MSKEILAIETMIASIDTIFQYTQSFDNADDFYHDQKSFDACMIHFINIGEMIHRIDPNFKQQHSNIPWQEIKDFRNLIANYLPHLKNTLQFLLQNIK